MPARSSATDLAPRLSSAPSAIEYWDVTAWFDSGERFSARFLITNQGPGTRTAAAVGHLLRPDGTVVPIKYGRLSSAWTLSDDRRRLKIASAVLDMTGPTLRVEVDSTKRGVKVVLEIPATQVTLVQPVSGYAIEVLAPAPARGEYQVSGMATPATLVGVAALTHTFIDRAEPELVTQRAELFGRAGDSAVYVNAVTLVAGGQRATVVRQSSGAVQVANDVTIVYRDAPAGGSDPGYAVPRRWEIADGSTRAVASLRREYLRWDPLEILPQPFRFLVSLQGAPRRVWSDADIEIAAAAGDPAPAAQTMKGIGVVTFARALPQ